MFSAKLMKIDINKNFISVNNKSTTYLSFMLHRSRFTYCCGFLKDVHTEELIIVALKFFWVDICSRKKKILFYATNNQSNYL